MAGSERQPAPEHELRSTAGAPPGFGALASAQPRPTAPGEPTWLRPILANLHEVLGLPEGWNSYRARRIEGQTATAVLQLLLDTMRSDTPAPSVVPTFPGGIQLEWHMRGIDLEVEITPQLAILATYEDDLTGEEWEADITTNQAPLQRALAILTERR